MAPEPRGDRPQMVQHRQETLADLTTCNVYTFSGLFADADPAVRSRYLTCAETLIRRAA